MSTSAILEQVKLVAGPILRHVSPSSITFWLVTSKPFELSLHVFDSDHNKSYLNKKLTVDEQQSVQVGMHAFIQLVSVSFDTPLPTQTLLYYQFFFAFGNERYSLSQLAPHLAYEDQEFASFIVNTDLRDILHGSCRKPHHDSKDSLVALDNLVAQSHSSATSSRPHLLLMTGDQVYMDDVAGPMLTAIMHTIELLGLFDETWQGADVGNSQALFDSEFCYYQRDKLLPRTKENKALFDKFFAASLKPIFTSINAHNHLITAAEMFAMYFLVWSPTLWAHIDLSKTKIPLAFQDKYNSEQKIVEAFSQGLPQVQRVLAHLPVYMIFDDHDVTDDWNLTRGWEETAYGHEFSTRIIGNALVAYWLCQGWGNAPQTFKDNLAIAEQHFTEHAIIDHDALIQTLLRFQHWHFTIDTHPKVVVLDTRTNRWRSESNANKPSGLMDWESLSRLQQELIGEQSIIMVSPAPVYGVKLIETIQRIFTFFGKALVVDAENWMAHKGTANVMLNIFHHPKTPPNFIILSGDVHYSFVYHVSPRDAKEPNIVQITASGIKNQFPQKLLPWFDNINRWLYGSRSPLNFFTKRRKMRVKASLPYAESLKTLANHSAIGRVQLDANGKTSKIELLTADGNSIEFN